MDQLFGGGEDAGRCRGKRDGETGGMVEGNARWLRSHLREVDGASGADRADGAGEGS